MPVLIAYLKQYPNWRQVVNLPMMRCLGLVALLAAELLFLTFRYDAGALASQQDWLAHLVASASIVPQLAAVMITATLIFSGEELFSGMRLLSEIAGSTDHRPRSRCWLWCLIHVLFIAAFVPLTASVFEGRLNAVLALTWLITGLGAGLSWCFAIISPASWSWLFQRHWLPLLGCVLIGGAAWGLGQLSERMWLPLGESTLWLVFRLLNLVTSHVVIDPSKFHIGTSAFVVEIAPQCSGYEGIGLAWVFMGTYLWWCRHKLRWPQAWLLFPLATGMMWLFNGVRIATLIMIGSYGWHDVALGGFHSQAGWLAYNLVMLGLVGYSRQSRFFWTETVPAPTTTSTGPAVEGKVGVSDPTAAYLLPLIALLAVLMVTGAFSSSFDWLYPIRVLVVSATIACFAREYVHFTWNWSWSALGIGSLVFVLWMVLEPWSQGQPVSSDLGMELARLPSLAAITWLVFRVIGSVLIAPFAEELAFRGYLMRRLVSADFETVPPNQISWPALLMSAALFGALHPGRWLAGTLAGLLYGLAVYRRGNLVDAFLAHAITNVLIAAYVLATGSWSLWS